MVLSAIWVDSIEMVSLQPVLHNCEGMNPIGVSAPWAKSFYNISLPPVKIARYKPNGP